MRWTQKTTVRFFILPMIALLLAATTALGQAVPPKPPTAAEFNAFLRAKLKQVDDMNDLDAATKAKAKDLYLQAIAEMESIRQFSDATARNEQLTKDAPKEIDNTRTMLATMPAQPIVAISAEITLQQFEQKISSKTGELEKARKDLADDEAELTGRAERRAKISEAVNKLRERQSNINAQLDVPAAADETPAAKAVNFAARMLLLTQQRRAEQEIVCYEKELAAWEARAKLLPLQHDLHAKKVALLEQEIKLYQETANQRRQAEVDLQTQQAMQEAKYADPMTQSLVKENADLAAKRKELAKNIAEVTEQCTQVNLKLDEVTKQATNIKKRVETAEKTNVTSAVGLFLRQQRERLPNLHEYARDIGVRRQTQGDAQLQLLQHQNDRLLLSNLEQQVALFLEKAAKDQGTAWQTTDQTVVAANVKEILKTKTEYLNALNDDYDAYNNKLTELIIAETKLMEGTEKCAHFIDQRVLWINSSAPISTSDLQQANQAFWWLVGPAAWADLGQTLAADAMRNPALYILALCIFAALFYWRFRFHAQIVEIGEKAARGNCCRFWPTLETTLLTTLVAVGWPSLMQFVGWRLTVAAGESALCRALGPGLTETARVFLALEMLRLICCPRGLAESHFGWSVGALRLIRSNIRWFSAPALLLMGVAVTMAWQDNNDWDASLGRICFVAALLCLSLALYRVLRPSSAMIQAMIAARRDGWLERFRYVWYPLCVFTPTALALMAAAGYHYTSRQLVIRLILTVYVLVGSLVCRALLLRWTLVNQRKLAIEQLKKRRAAAQGESKTNVNDEKLPNTAVSERDLATINVQTKRLIEYAISVAAALVIWCAWVDVLPALDAINIPIGTYDTDNASNDAAPNGAVTTMPTVATSTAVATATAAQAASNGDAVKTKMSDPRIKLAHLLLAIIIFATTAIAAKNIPGLLEMAILQHLPVDAGARYAIATVSRYVVTITGVLWGCGILGIGWSKVQWLVAAMGLGLGFGLQEIFANFISGLIILFERPIRVGDVVTIGLVTGVVSRIHMRATTIIDGDRKELIIPNKEFITGQVLNWTLTDPVNRVAINVGVAYGSDTAQTARILEKIAKDHPLVLDEPAPKVSLESFGASALNFVLRCFLPNLENRLTVINDLHMAIDREFQKAGIEMPYPQHDVHVRTIDGISPALQSVIAGAGPAWPTLAKAKAERVA